MFKLLEQPSVVASRLSDPEQQRKFLAGVTADPLKFFCPNGAQERIINTVAMCTEDTQIPVILYMHANGVGKTTVTEHILGNIIFGPQNGWFDYPVFRNFPFPRSVWYCSDADALEDPIIPLFEKTVNQDANKQRSYKIKRKGTRPFKIEFDHVDFEWHFKTYDQAKSAYEAATVGIIVADEPMPEELWKSSKSRRRLGNMILMPMTPLYCPPYVVDEVQKAVDDGVKGYYKLEADIYEACQRRGIRGHLNPDVIDQMIKGYDADEREARAYGRVMYFSKRIYDILDAEVHLVSPDEFPIPPHSKILHIVDPHDSRPSAAIWGAVTPEGRKIIFGETPGDKTRPYWEFKRALTIDEEVATWSAFENEMKLDRVERILDRNFGWQTRGQKTFAQLFQDAGVRIGKDFTFMKSYHGSDPGGEIAYGHKAVRKALSDKLPDGKPKLVIWNTCYHTWQGLTHYIRRHETGKRADEKVPADAKIVEKYKDFPDVVRYFVCSDILPEPTVKPYAKPWAELQRVQGMNQTQTEWD
jgi:hypothetical protein